MLDLLLGDGDLDGVGDLALFLLDEETTRSMSWAVVESLTALYTSSLFSALDLLLVVEFSSGTGGSTSLAVPWSFPESILVLFSSLMVMLAELLP